MSVRLGAAYADHRREGTSDVLWTRRRELGASLETERRACARGRAEGTGGHGCRVVWEDGASDTDERGEVFEAGSTNGSQRGGFRRARMERLRR